MRLLIVGYYGYDNLGDELLAKAALQILKGVPATSIVLSPALRRPVSFLRAVFSCQGLVFGGGSLFQDVTGKGLTVLYYTGIALVGLLLGKKLFFIGQGLGPIQRPINRYLLRFVLQRAEFISLRNRESLAFVQALGINSALLANDLLFTQSGPKVIQRKTNKKIKIVLSFRSGLTVDRLQALCSSLKQYELVVVPLQKQQDTALIKSLKKQARVIAYDPVQIVQEIATADLAVGMRLHFLILAALQNVPFIGIAYDPKVQGICKHWHMPFVRMSELEKLPDLIAREVPKCMHHRSKLLSLLEREKELGTKHSRLIQESIRHAFS
jgi:polysaccharide pyruvyl transferase CsaB